MKIIAIVNQKGGSGKTTTAINVACVLARRGWPTLLVDMDPQSHCAVGLGVPETVLDSSLTDALATNDFSILDRARLGAARNLDLIPSTAKLAGIEAARGGLADAADREDRLASVLRPFAEKYPWCIIDCPPSIGLLTFNALRAADEVLIPVETGYFALQGAMRQVKTIAALARRTGHASRAWIVATMHDHDTAVSRDVLKELKTRFPKNLCPVVIRFDAALKEAASLGTSVVDHAPTSLGATDYLALASWIAETTGSGLPEPLDPDALTDHAADPVDDPQDDLLVHVRNTTLSRAADLAVRTRRLLERTGAMARRLAADSTVEEAPVPISGPVAGWLGGLGGPTPMPAESATTLAQTPSLTGAKGEGETGGAVGVGNDVARLYGVRVTSRGVLFVFPAGPDVAVCIASDLNGWCASAHRMRYNAAICAHEICIPMPPGLHRYRIVVDGQWIKDPNNAHAETNPFGQLDSIVIVGDNPASS